MFERTLAGLNLADGTEKLTAELSTEGDTHATHTEPFVALPSSTSTVMVGRLKVAKHQSVRLQCTLVCCGQQYRAIAELQS
jgi:hypothetical protein